MAAVERPFVYRTTDPIQNLRIRVTVRQSHTIKTSDGDARDSPVPVSRTFKWQEKEFAPWELARYFHYAETHPAGHGGLSSSSYLERVRTWDQGARARCLEELDTHGVYLFTYVDADDHLPAFHDQPSTDSVAPARAVTEAMAKLPDRTAPVSAAAAKVQHLMNRSSICQVMHVMACVATDRGRLERDLMHRSGAGGVAASMAEYATEVARGDLQHEGPWKELRKPRKVVEEHALCTIRMHSGGALEVTPGFSEEEAESDDEGPYRSLRSLRIVNALGPRLTTFSFVARDSHGVLDRVFQYTVENACAETDPIRLDQMVLEDTGPSRTREEQFALPDGLETAKVGCLHLRVELLEALGFEGVDALYGEWQLLLPDGFAPASQAQGGSQAEDGSQGGQRFRWRFTEQSEWALAGATRLASVKDLPRGLHKQRGGAPAASGGSPVLLAVSLVACVAGLLTGLVRVAAGALLVALGASYARLDPLDSCLDSEEACAQWGAKIDLGPVLVSSSQALASPPSLLVQVSSIDSLGLHHIEGYAALNLPTKAGMVDLEVATWRPKMSAWSQMVDLVIGGAGRLSDLRFAHHPPRLGGGDLGHKRRFLSRFGMATETTGRVRLRAHAVEQFLGTRTAEAKAPAVRRPAAQRTQRIESILKRYSGGEGDGARTVTSLADLDGETTADKAKTFIRDLQERRARTHQEHASTSLLRSGPLPSLTST